MHACIPPTMSTEGDLSSGVKFAPRPPMSAIDSAWVTSVPHDEYRSVRKFGVPPRYSSTVVADKSDASILPQSVLNSARVMSLVQHVAEASVPALASLGTKGEVHLTARSVAWCARAGYRHGT